MASGRFFFASMLDFQAKKFGRIKTMLYLVLRLSVIYKEYGTS